MEGRPRFSGKFSCVPEFISITLINSYTFKKSLRHTNVTETFFFQIGLLLHVWR